MQIGGDYPRPVMINGYACNNCAEVSAAKRGLDPEVLRAQERPVVEWGGTLAEQKGAPSAAASASEPVVDRYV